MFANLTQAYDSLIFPMTKFTPSLMFLKKSILYEYGADQLSECGSPTYIISDTSDKDRPSREDSNEDENEDIKDRLHTNTGYVDKRSRRTRGNKITMLCYQLLYSANQMCKMVLDTFLSGYWNSNGYRLCPPPPPSPC